jgi:thiamine kinase-like enzyme
MINFNMVSKPIVRTLLEQIGEIGTFSLTPLNGGWNNRAFRLEINNKRFFLKEYFRDKKDTHDRLTSEFSFCTFANAMGVKSVPKPFVLSKQSGLGLFEFIEGVNCRQKDATLTRVMESAEFFCHLNKSKEKPLAQKLSKASEACFSVEDHFSCVSLRINRLKEIPLNDPLSKKAVCFARDQLDNHLKTIIKFVEKSKQPHEIKEIEYCISPSDFGFHNMLIDKEGILRFVDFEYAGWDDPAKMICDFFCQPRITINKEWLIPFIEKALIGHPCLEEIITRAKLLYPLYRLKWCGIILNEFLPEGAKRRAFAGSSTTINDRKLAKLAAASEYLDKSPLCLNEIN